MSEPVITAELGKAQSNYLNSFVERYKAHTKQTAENILALGAVVIEAEEELSAKYLPQFFEAIGLNPKSATVRKLRVIGKEHARLEPVVDRLPHSWTTIYALAKMKPDAFKLVTASDALSPQATMKAIMSVLSSGSRRGPSAKVAVDISKLSDQAAQKKFVKELADLLGKYSMEPSVPKEHVALLDQLIHASPKKPAGRASV